jgi:hypothetical protein
MKTITIQKISYNQFSADVICSQCGKEIKYVFDDLSTQFPYYIKGILMKIDSLHTQCICNHMISSKAITQIFLIEQENIEYKIICNLKK